MHLQPKFELPEILVVDDDRDFVEETSETLTTQGWNAHAVTSAAHALAFLEDANRNIGVVISDLYMPDASGIRLARELRARLGSNRPEMILMSGRPSTDALFTAIRLEVVDFLAKPVRSGELLGAVDHAIDRLRQRFCEAANGVEKKVLETGPLHARDLSDKIDPLKLLLDINQAAMDQLDKDQLDYQQMRILVDIAWHDRNKKRVTVTGLAYGLSVPAATSHRKLKGLEMRGLVERVPDENDGRLTYMSLTEEGWSSVDRLATQILKKLDHGKP